ncbi:MAG TPA: dienelactone hydrolase family protein [Acidimicrobiales bacterium]|nr:dienelactone hydrolase family protein [Acidimicrobiales bacterium]
MTMQFVDEVTEKGVMERRFTVERPDELVPGVMWTPDGATGSRPLVLIGHGGTQHKRSPNVVALARGLVRHQGYAAVAIDAPWHGDRTPPDERDLPADERRRRMASRLFGRGRGETTARMLGDWTATLDAAQALPEVGPGPVGYWGLSMGCAFGVPLVAGEPRVGAAVLGLFGWAEGLRLTGYDDLARSITVPLLFLVQWDDEVVDHDHAVELFRLFGSTDKTLHANPGRHVEVPVAERAAAEAFFDRHLGALTPA